MIEEHWERDKEKFEDDFEGGRDYRDEERREYGGDGYGRRGGDTIIENETFVNDDRYGGDQYYKETTVVRDDGYGDSGYRGDRYQDDSFVDDAARWTGNKVSSHLGGPFPRHLLTFLCRCKRLKTCRKTPLDGLERRSAPIYAPRSTRLLMIAV